MRVIRAGRLSGLPGVVAAALLVACSAGETQPASPTGSTAEASANAASAAASSGPVDLGTVTLVRDGCSLDASTTTVEATSVRVAVINQTEYPGAFDWWRIDGDRTYQDLVDHVAAEAAAASEGDPGLGHPGFVSANLSSGIVRAGESAQIQGTVTPGTYAVVCLGHFDAVSDDPFRPMAVVGPIAIR